MYNVKTPLLDDLIIRLKKKHPFEYNDLPKAIEEALKLKTDTKKYCPESAEWDIQMEKYWGQMKYIDGYLRALLCVNIIRTTKWTAYEKKSKKSLSIWRCKNDKRRIYKPLV